MLDEIDFNMTYATLQEQAKLLSTQNTLLTEILTTIQQQSKLLQNLNDNLVKQSKLLVNIKPNRPVYHFEEP